MAQYNNPGLPASLYSGGNVRIDTRQLGNMLYNEQKIREATRQKEAAVLYDEMKSNVAKIRDADVPDFVSGFQDYRAAKMGLNDPRLKRDPQAFAQAQMEVQRKYGNVMKLANASKQDREDTETLRKDWLTHHDNYDDNFALMLATRNRTPYSKLNQVDLGEKDDKGNAKYRNWTGFDDFLYKNQYDPTKLLTTAQGEKLTNEIDEGATDKTGLQNKVTTYQFYGAKPNEYKDTIMRGMAGDRSAMRFFSNELKNTSPEEIARVSAQFQAIPADVWKKMGIDKVDLKVENPDNQAEVAATYLAQKHAIENMPRAIKSDLRTNEAVKMKMNQGFDLYIEGVKQNNRERLKSMKDAGGKEGDSGYDIVETMWQEAKNNPRTYTPANGKPYTQYSINPTQQQKEVFAYKYLDEDGKSKTIYPEEFRFSKDGKYITPIFFNDTNPSATGKRGVDASISKPVLVDVIRSSEGKRNFGTKENKNIMTGKGKAQNVDVTNTHPADWTKEGKYWKYKDGSLYDDNGKRVK